MELEKIDEIRDEAVKVTRDAEKLLDELFMEEARWYERVWWGVSDAWNSARRGIKWKFQRMFRGYSDYEVWNLGCASAKYILPRLKAFAEDTIAYPPAYETFEDWKADLEKMIAAFDWAANLDEREDELIRKCGGYFAKDADGETAWVKRLAEKEKEVEEGMALFGKNILNLWW